MIGISCVEPDSGCQYYPHGIAPGFGIARDVGQHIVCLRLLLNSCLRSFAKKRPLSKHGLGPERKFSPSESSHSELTEPALLMTPQCRQVHGSKTSIKLRAIQQSIRLVESKWLVRYRHFCGYQYEVRRPLCSRALAFPTGRMRLPLYDSQDGCQCRHR
jgi:hypothetical protein